MSVAVIIIVIVILVLVLIGLGYFICHRMKDSGRPSSFSYSDRGGSTLGRRATLFGRRGSVTGAIQRIHLGDTKRRSIAPNKKRSPKDVTLITKLRGDGIITTWTAKAVSTPSNDPQFVARTVTDSAQMIDLYNFQSAAAYFSSLDKNMNVVNFLGAAVDNVPYYLYQEYVQCGSLRDYLTTNYRQERASSCNLFDAKQRRNLGSRDSSSLLIAFAKRIANGMAFLESKKYRHPALSARKVLLTPAGNCKLYDFWPKRLTPHRVKQILSKKPQPVAWLAPETLFMDEHTEKSDTWSFAVVLWEIFSLGEIPYVGKTVQEIETAVRANENLNQPLSCTGGWYELMLSCWDRRPKRRPSFQQIKDEIITSITGMGDDRLNVEDEEGNYITISPF